MDRHEIALAAMQAEVRAFLGKERSDAIHAPRVWLDYVVVVGLPAVAIAIFVSCFFVENFVALACLAIGQGIVLQLFGLVNHEFFVHRKVGGRFSYWLSVLFTVPIQLSSTRYADAHWAHHEFVGTGKDAEAYKTDIDTRFKKLLFTTVIGTKWAASGKMGAGRAPYFQLRKPTPRAEKRAAFEQIISTFFLIAAGTSAYFYFIPILFGYLIPLLILLPFLNSIRILIEHAEVQPDNSYSIASRFTCSVVEDVLFLYDSGEYHLIHHYLPNVPFYRMRAARALLDPFFDSHKIMRSSGWHRLLFGWFVRNENHGGWWGHNKIAASNTEKERQM